MQLYEVLFYSCVMHSFFLSCPVYFELSPLHTPQYLFHNILHILFRHHRTTGQAQPSSEECLTHPIHIARIVLIHRLLVHRLP